MSKELEKYTDDQLSSFMRKRDNIKKIPIIEKQIELCRRILYTIGEIEKLHGGTRETAKELALYKSALNYCKAFSKRLRQMEESEAFWEERCNNEINN